MVTIQDINDNAPLCLPPMSGTVRENSPAGSHVLTVNATDRDEGENAQLSFRFVYQLSLLLEQRFLGFYRLGSNDGVSEDNC